MRIGSRLLAVGAVVAVTASLSVGSASADPGVVPQTQDLVGVGAQTTYSVLNQFSVDYNASLTAKGDTTSPRLYSWDTTGTSPVVTKSGAASVPRPDGASAGIRRLVGSTGGTVDFARSDRSPVETDAHGLDFVVVAKDAVTWSASKNGNAPAQLTPAQLASIYTCIITNWQQIDPSLPNATIKPYLPQIDAGTRAVFLASIGRPTLGGCVVTGPEENQGTDPALNDPNAVFPYSVGHYLGQTVGGHSTTTDAPGNLTLRNVVVNGITIAAVTNNVIDGNFANSQFGNMVYNVFRDAEWSGTDAHAQALQNVFGYDGWICNAPIAAADLASYGFLATPACGVETLT
ncbi:PstS family phosphate ABC transporter substrate-binding protein [Kitasatospora sp. NPDC094011]|uniref:PstS family phosphate ABC transporter substrate-binding protein n=1 Tax=Kitasatospora sp. NPDC094011 TaxID=3364090 RepID=UPI0037FCA86C